VVKEDYECHSMTCWQWGRSHPWVVAAGLMLGLIGLPVIRVAFEHLW
jgi:hypothetical protein